MESELSFNDYRMDESTYEILIRFPFMIDELDTEHDIIGCCGECGRETSENRCDCCICNLDNFTFRCELCEDDQLCQKSIYDYCECWQLKNEDIEYDYYAMKDSHKELFTEMKHTCVEHHLPKMLPMPIIDMITEYL